MSESPHVAMAATIAFNVLDMVAKDNADRVEVVFRHETKMRLRFHTPLGPRYADYTVTDANA